ncbi:hypothetical protein Tco_1184709 [Tanacetum coccineum]
MRWLGGSGGAWCEGDEEMVARMMMAVVWAEGDGHEDDGDGLKVVLEVIWWGGRVTAAGGVVGSRVTASDSGDRVDRVSGSIFGVGRKTRRKSFPAAGDGGGGGRVVAGGGREK